MTFQEFIPKWTGKPVDTDGVYPNQCMDLAHEYVQDVLGLGVTILSHPSAYQVFTDFTETQSFTRIYNSPTNIPLPGDLVIFGQAIGTDGHICVFISGDTNTFQSFDANWPTGSLPHVQNHDYNGVLGWLHPNIQSTTGVMYKGYDLTNQDSMKVAIDILVQVQSGQFVPLADMNAISTPLGLPAGSNKDAINAAIATLQKDKAADEASLITVNKQIPDLEGQISTLKNRVTSLEQQLQTAQDALKEPTSGLLYKDLYVQVEINLVAAKAALAALTTTTNRQIAQLQNTSATTMPFPQLWKIFFARSLHLS